MIGFDYYCIECERHLFGGCWIFTESHTSVWPRDGLEHTVTHNHCVCPDCIDEMRQKHMSDEDIKTLRWEED
jgi:hypothetical protein